LLKKPLFFAPTDEIWKIKRKACAHAFYKDKIGPMMDSLKEKMADKFRLRLKEIENSPDGSVTIDMTSEFRDIFARNMSAITIGKDVQDEKFEITKFYDQPDGSTVYEKSMESMSQAMPVILMQSAMHGVSCMDSTLGFLKILTPAYNMFSKKKQIIKKNSETVRNFILKIVKDRRSGKFDSEIREEQDIISLLLKCKEYDFTDDDIADEVIGFVMAGAGTSQMAT